MATHTSEKPGLFHSCGRLHPFFNNRQIRQDSQPPVHSCSHVCFLSATDYLTADAFTDSARVGCDLWVLFCIRIYDESTNKVGGLAHVPTERWLWTTLVTLTTHKERPQGEPNSARSHNCMSDSPIHFAYFIKS